MSETFGEQGHGHGRQAEAIDLSVLERVERELDAVERALEQIDQGVYDGFAGLDEDARIEPVAPADTGAADAEDEGPTGYT